MRVVRVKEVPAGWEITVRFDGVYKGGGSRDAIYLITPADLPANPTKAGLKQMIRNRVKVRNQLRRLIQNETL